MGTALPTSLVQGCTSPPPSLQSSLPMLRHPTLVLVLGTLACLVAVVMGVNQQKPSPQTVVVARGPVLPPVSPKTRPLFSNSRRGGGETLTGILHAAETPQVLRVDIVPFADAAVHVVDKSLALVPLTIADGSRFVCALPRSMSFPNDLLEALEKRGSDGSPKLAPAKPAEPVETAPASDSEAQSGGANTLALDVDELLEAWEVEEQAVFDVLKPLEGRCLLYEYGWWRYELCFGSHIRQWHDKDQDFKLGIFNQAESEAAQVAEVESHLDSLVVRQLDPDTAPAEAWKPSYLTQIYDSGTVCDLTGLPRQTELLFTCKPSVPGAALVQIEELRTCVYRIRINTALMCTPEAMASFADTSISPTATSATTTSSSRHHSSKPLTSNSVRVVSCAPIPIQ